MCLKRKERSPIIAVLAAARDVWSNREEVLRLAAAERDGRVPTELLPRCPHCGGPAEVDMASGQDYFVAPLAGKRRLSSLCRMHRESGCSFSSSASAGAISRIKAPLMRLVEATPNARYVTFNKGEIYIPDAIAEKIHRR